MSCQYEIGLAYIDVLPQFAANAECFALKYTILRPYLTD